MIFINDEFFNYKQIMISSYVDQLQIVDDIEMQNLQFINIYVRIKRFEILKKIKIFIIKLIYKFKKNLIDKITRYKIKCVMKKFMQQKKIDYNDIFVFVVKFMSFKTLFAIVIKLNFDCDQIDIKTIFLNFVLQKKMYVTSFENYENFDHV